MATKPNPDRIYEVVRKILEARYNATITLESKHK